MLKKTTLLFFISIICVSCKKQIIVKEKAKETSSEYINFNIYTFNTTFKTENKISLEKEKKYVLDFWYLECAPCVKQHQEIKEYQNQLIDNNIEVIGISIDMSQKKWKDYIESHQYNWKNYNQFGGKDNLKDDLDIKIFPTYFLVDHKGNIEKKFNAFHKVIAYLKID